MSNNEKWLSDVLPKHRTLTESVKTTLESLIKSENIDYLTVTGRTKDEDSALEKIKRKSYDSPEEQMTDLSGLRVIVFLESDAKKVSEIVEKSFNIDNDNSSNQDKNLSVNRIGYRSIHYVCDLGDDRTKLPEFNALKGLKFEIQIRTVLQHAWAELAHDRNYKFSGSLPQSMERNLNLYSGMLEIADKGFSQLSNEIDEYRKKVKEKSDEGDLDFELNNLSLHEFVYSWASKEGLDINYFPHRDKISILVSELEQFGVTTAEQLNNIIPKDYSKTIKELNIKSNIFGYVRDWMIIHDWNRLVENVSINWCLDKKEKPIYKALIQSEDFTNFEAHFDWEDVPY